MSRTSLSGPEIRQLTAALTSAFDRNGLKQLVSSSLNRNLDDIVEPNDLTDTTFELIQWTISHGELATLVKAAFEWNPKNPNLLAFRQTIWDLRPDTDAGPAPIDAESGTRENRSPVIPTSLEDQDVVASPEVLKVRHWQISRRIAVQIAGGVAGLVAVAAFVGRQFADGDRRFADSPTPEATLAAGDLQPTVASPGPPVTQEPPPPTPTIVAPTGNVQFGAVPFPEFTDRLIPDARNAAWEDLGRRDVKGVVYHRTSGSIEGTDAWLRLVPDGGAGACQPGDLSFGGCMALVDFGIDETFGEILRWNDPYGLAYPEQGVSANRSGWANGPVQDPIGAGKAFVDQNGATAVNRDQVSIQIGGNFDDPISEECKRAVAALSAYFADQANIRWNDYPTLPGEAYGFVRWHNEFYPFRECPGPVVTAATTEIIDLTREMMRDYQVL